MADFGHWGPYGATYLPFLLLHHTGWSTQMVMLTFKGLGAASVVIGLMQVPSRKLRSRAMGS